MVTANRASSDTIDEVLSEIRTQGLHATQIIDRQRTMLRSHQLDKKPTDLQRRDQGEPGPGRARHESEAGRGHRQSFARPVGGQRRPGAPAAGARELDDERHGRDVPDAARPSHADWSAPTFVAPMSTSRCAIPARACPRISTASCSRHSSRPNRTAWGSASPSCRQSSPRMAAPSTRTTIRMEARHSPSRCAAAKRRKWSGA